MKNRGAFVPFHHQFVLAQLIRGIIYKGGKQEYLNYTYFNFSGLKGQTEISRDGLHFKSSRVTLVMSASEKNFIDYFLETLFKLRQVEVGNLILKPEFAEVEDQPTFSESGKYICISPIVILKPEFNDAEAKRFIDPFDDSFSDFLYESTMERMEATGNYTPEQISSFYKFQVVPDKNYIMRLQRNQKKFARIYPMFDSDIRYEVRGYTFPFELFAAPEVQEFIYTCGLGLFTYKGLGMLDMADGDPNRRTHSYAVNVTEQAD